MLLPWICTDSILHWFAFESHGALYIMIGILITSQKVGSENRHLKHVAPHQTELAILPREMAETFCRHAIEGFHNYQSRIGLGFSRPLKVVESR